MQIGITIPEKVNHPVIKNRKPRYFFLSCLPFDTNTVYIFNETVRLLNEQNWRLQYLQSRRLTVFTLVCYSNI